MELKVLLVFFVGIGFCYAKPFPHSLGNNGPSSNNKINISVEDDGHHISPGPESPPRTEYPQHFDDISQSGGHQDPISSLVKHIVKDSTRLADLPLDVPLNPIPDLITQPIVNPLAIPHLVSYFIQGGYRQVSDSRETEQGSNTSTNTLKLTDLAKNNVSESTNESITKFTHLEEENATDTNPVISIQQSVYDNSELVASNQGEVIPTDGIETGGHNASYDSKKRQAIKEDPLVAIITPLVGYDYQSGARHVRHAEKIIINIPSSGLKTNILDNANAADFIKSESTVKSELPKHQSEFDRPGWSSSKTADDDETKEELGERFGEDLELYDSVHNVPSDPDYYSENDTIILTIASSVLKTFLLDNVRASDFYGVLQEEPGIDIKVGDKEEIFGPCSYGNNSGIVEKFGSEGVYPFYYANVEEAPRHFKHNTIKYYDDGDKEDGFDNLKQVAENHSEEKRTKRSLLSLIQDRISTNGSTSDSESSDNSAFSATNETGIKNIGYKTKTRKEKQKIDSIGPFFGITDQLSHIVKSPVNWSELHQREEVKHSNDKFEEKVIQSAFQTIIDDVSKEIKSPSRLSTKENITDSSQSQHHKEHKPSKSFFDFVAREIVELFPGFPTFKTLTEEESETDSSQEQNVTIIGTIMNIPSQNVNDNQTRVARSPSKKLVSPYFDQVSEHYSLPGEHEKNTNTNSNETKQEKQSESDQEESKPKSLVKTAVDESFRISDAVQTFFKERFGRSPSKELTSSFFDQVSEDGSLPGEHSNNTNSYSSIPTQETENPNESDHEEGKLKSLLKTVLDKSFHISNAVKTSVHDRFGRSIENSKVKELDKCFVDKIHSRSVRSPSKDLVSPFFDQVSEDDSLSGEHKNSSNNNPSTEKKQQEKQNRTSYEDGDQKSFLKTVLEKKIQVSDAVKISRKDIFERSIIAHSPEIYIVDDAPDKDNKEVYDHDSEDLESASGIGIYTTSKSDDVGLRRKKRSVKSEFFQDEIEVLKEIRDLNKDIIKSAQKSSLDEEPQMPENSNVTFMNDEWLKKIMQWAQKPDYPYDISFGEDTPTIINNNETSDFLNNAADIPADLDESFLTTTEYKTQSNLKERFFDDSADDAAELSHDDESEDNSGEEFYSDYIPDTHNGDQKDIKDIPADFDESFITNTDYKTQHIPEESFFGESNGAKIDHDDILEENPDESSEYYVNGHGEELDDEGHVYPDWNWADQKSRIPDPNGPTV